jgi:hypothetical protein
MQARSLPLTALLLATALGCGAKPATPTRLTAAPSAAHGAGATAASTAEPTAPPRVAATVEAPRPGDAAAAGEPPEPATDPLAGELRLVWAPDERAFVAACPPDQQTTSASVIELRSGATPIDFGAKPPAYVYPVWDHRGSLLALSTDVGIYLWERAKRRVRVKLPPQPAKGMEWVPPSVYFSPTQPWLASFTVLTVHEAFEVSTEVKIWNTTTGALASRFVNQPLGEEVKAINDLRWHPRDSVVLTCAGVAEWWNGSHFTGAYVRIWRAGTGQSLGRLPGHSMEFSPDGRFLAVTRGNARKDPAGSTTDIYDTRTNAKLLDLKGSAEVWAPDGSWLVTSIADFTPENLPPNKNTVYRLWGLPGGGLLAALDFGRGGPTWLPDKGWAAVPHVGGDGYNPDYRGLIEIWDIHAARRIRSVTVQPYLYPERWLAGGRVLELANERGVARQLLQIETGRTIDLEAKGEAQGCRLSLLSNKQEIALGDLARFLAPP